MSYKSNETRLASARKYRLTHKEKIREIGRIYYLAHKEEFRDYAKKYNATNKDKVAKRNKDYGATHRDQIRARGREYRESHRAQIAAQRSATKEQKAAQNKIYRTINREKISARRKADYASNPEKYLTYQHSRRDAIRYNNLRRKYGISKDDFNALLLAQGGACAICKKPDWNGTGPHIDHNHTTGKVRSILCGNCNRAIGMIYDNPQIAHSMTVYLLEHYGRPSNQN